MKNLTTVTNESNFPYSQLLSASSSGVSTTFTIPNWSKEATAPYRQVLVYVWSEERTGSSTYTIKSFSWILQVHQYYKGDTYTVYPYNTAEPISFYLRDEGEGRFTLGLNTSIQNVYITTILLR